MAFPPGPQPQPTPPTAGVSPNDGAIDLRRPEAHAALRVTTEGDAQTLRLLVLVLPRFAFSFAACRVFTFSLWHSFLLSLVFAVGLSFKEFVELYYPPPSPRLKDVNRALVSDTPGGAECKTVHEDKDVDKRAVDRAPAAVQVEPGANEFIEISDSEVKNENEVIEISDSEDENEEETSPPGQCSGEVDDQASEEEGQDESARDDQGVHAQQGSPLATDSGVSGGLDAQSPISITDEDEADLSGITLVEPESYFDIPHPSFASEYPPLKRKSNAPPPAPRPSLPPDLQHIDLGYAFEPDFGWVLSTPKKRSPKDLKGKIIQDLTEKDRNSGVVYILRHSRYENLFKIGCTSRSVRERKAESPPCVKEMTKEAYVLGKMWGFRRVESLAHRDMADRNVRIKLCLACFNKTTEAKDKKRRRSQREGEEGEEAQDAKESKSHREWFKGDLEDITRCVEYWAEVVRASYEGGEFVGNVSEVASRGLSSQKRRLEEGEDSARLREKLNESPSRRPQSAGAAGQPDAGTHAAPERVAGAGEVEDEEDGELDEVCSARRGVIWERRDTSDDRPFPTPEKRAPRRGPRARKSSGTEGVASRRSPRLRKSGEMEEVAHRAGGLPPGVGVKRAVQCQA